jgi:hypothetical protein
MSEEGRSNGTRTSKAYMVRYMRVKIASDMSFMEVLRNSILRDDNPRVNAQF